MIETVPHTKQRYETVGDWYIAPDGSWRVNVSEMDDWCHEALIAIHELCEMVMCMQRGIAAGALDRFDIEFKPKREGDEPGDDPQAPYQREHCIATGIERLLCAALDVKWQEYDDAVNSL